MKDIIKGTIYGFLSFKLIMLTNNFEFVLRNENITMTEAMFRIYVPKLIFTAFLSFAMATLKGPINFNKIITSLSVSLTIVGLLQSIDVLQNITIIRELVYMGDTRGTFLPFSIWWFIVLITILMPVIYEMDSLIMIFAGLGSILIITLLLLIPIYGYQINRLFWVGIQMGGFFSLFNIIFNIYYRYIKKGEQQV